jgi:hypothetical protein
MHLKPVARMMCGSLSGGLGRRRAAGRGTAGVRRVRPLDAPDVPGAVEHVVIIVVGHGPLGRQPQAVSDRLACFWRGYELIGRRVGSWDIDGLSNINRSRS